MTSLCSRFDADRLDAYDEVDRLRVDRPQWPQRYPIGNSARDQRGDSTHRSGRVVSLALHVRSTVADWCYEVPAGGLSPDLAPEEVAQRELLEEVGGTAADLRYIEQFYTSNGISNEVAYVYLSASVELGETHLEPTELMEIRLVPVDEALRMAREGEVTDGPSALALLWCEPLLT